MESASEGTSDELPDLKVLTKENFYAYFYEYCVRHYGADILLSVLKCLVPGVTEEKLFNITLEPRNEKYYLKEERNRIKELPLVKYDVSLLHKLLISAHKGMSPILRNANDHIYSERNRVCHNDMSMTRTEFKWKSKELAQHFKNALDEVQKTNTKLKAEFDKKITEINSVMELANWEENQINLKIFASTLRDQARKGMQIDLKNLFEQLCRVYPYPFIPSMDFTEPSAIAVPLQISFDSSRDVHKHHPAGKSKLWDHWEFLAIKDSFGSEPQVVILSGDPGCGKTFILNSILEQWYKPKESCTNSFGNLHEYEVLLRMEFRQWDYNNFQDYLKDILRHVTDNYKYTIVESAILESKCLILCDGYDERNAKSMSLFKEILKKQFKNVKIVVTTRYLSETDLLKNINSCKRKKIVLKIRDVSLKGIHHFIPKIIGYLGYDYSEMETELIHNFFKLKSGYKNKIQQLKNPHHITLFIYLWKEKPLIVDTIRTNTHLFSFIEQFSETMLLEKLGGADNDSALKKFRKFYRQFSFQIYIKYKYELSEDDLRTFKTFSDKINLVNHFDALMSSHFNVKLSHKRFSISPVRIYCYRHRMQQEFAAAGHICDMITNLHSNKSEFERLKESHLNVIKHLGNVQPGMQEEILQKVLQFVTGILYTTNKKLLLEVIDDILDMVLLREPDNNIIIIDSLLDHLRESSVDNQTSSDNVELEASFDSDVFEAVLKILKAKEETKWSLKKSYNLDYVTPLLKQVQPCKFSFLLDYDYQDMDLKYLRKALEVTSSKEIPVDLHLPMHYDGRVGRNADVFLKTAGESCQSFIGNLSDEGIDHIPANIEDLCIRIGITGLPKFSNRLPTFHCLKCLALIIPLDLSGQWNDLKPLQYFGEKLTITMELEESGDNEVRPVSNLLNQLWPRHTQTKETVKRQKLRESERDTVRVTRTSFTDVGVEDLIKSMNMLSLKSVDVLTTQNISKTREDKLASLCKEKNFGELCLLQTQ